VNTTHAVAAFDVGGTRIKACLVDESCTVLAAVTMATPRDVAVSIDATIATGVALLQTDAGRLGTVPSVAGCGVVVPGLVDERDGVGRLSANLGWRDLAVRELVADRLGVPVVVGHDVRAGLLAESRLGAGREVRNQAFVPVGTGIAAALMVDGHVLSAGGWAGELGHLVVRPDGPECRCGQRGCLETLASAAAVERRYAAVSGERVTAAEVAARVSNGDRAAMTVWHQMTDALVDGLVATVTLTGVELVLLGGGLAESGELLLDPVRRGLQGRLTFQRGPRVERAALGERAGAMGAACLAWDRL
jgi:glucokinase